MTERLLSEKFGLVYYHSLSINYLQQQKIKKILKGIENKINIVSSKNGNFILDNGKSIKVIFKYKKYDCLRDSTLPNPLVLEEDYKRACYNFVLNNLKEDYILLIDYNTSSYKIIDSQKLGLYLLNIIKHLEFSRDIKYNKYVSLNHKKDSIFSFDGDTIIFHLRQLQKIEL